MMTIGFRVTPKNLIESYTSVEPVELVPSFSAVFHSRSVTHVISVMPPNPVVKRLGMENS
jgi:hypothetical protein